VDHLFLGSFEFFLRDLLTSLKLVDLKPTKMVPTWRNGRAGQFAIARRLDRCLVPERTLSTMGLSRTWVEYPYISDHAPILIQLENALVYKAFPFKFNALWVQESEFKNLVHTIWSDPRFLLEGNCQQRLVWRLKELKLQTKIWSKEVSLKKKESMENWELEIEQLLYKLVEGSLSLEDDGKLQVLESNRNNLLREEEEAWRLRSRVTWIRSGDSNTKFFHKMASYNRNRKHVWELTSSTGIKITGQEAIKEEAFNHFKDFFRAKDRSDYSKLVRISSLYPKMVTEEEADLLLKPVMLEEIKSVLEKFNKDRSPGPDGWTTKFFISFFDLVGEDLARDGGGLEEE
jgi:hypothetical protein